MRPPDKKRPGQPILASDWNLLIDALMARTPKPGVGLELVAAPGGFTFRVRPAATSQSPSQTCPFGQIISWVSGDPPVLTTGIRGGAIYCGDQNWSIVPYAIDLETDGAWLVSIAVACEVNRDDDGELLLPNVKTGTEPTAWTLTAWTEGTNYPENTQPTTADGLGTIVLPVGKLTVANGSATLEPTGCGGFAVGHCAGTLSFTRL